jgi:tRNA nucleotidyltransferase (CCA-adding enzyme)
MIFQQLDEVLLTAERPSLQLEALRADGTLHQVPELLTLPGVMQNPRWHPEGDVWAHTLMVVDQAVHERTLDHRHDRLLMWAALCHDLGKPRCTVFRDGAWRSPGHDLLGVEPTRALLSRLTDDQDLLQGVCRLVLDHLAPHFYQQDGASPRAIRGLLRRLGDLPLSLLVRLGRADSFGRTTEDARRREYPSGDWLLDRAAGLPPPGPPEPERPPPIVMGRHLLPLGLVPGPHLGALLKELHQAQLAGQFIDVEGGIDWLRRTGKVPIPPPP